MKLLIFTMILIRMQFEVIGNSEERVARNYEIEGWAKLLFLYVQCLGDREYFQKHCFGEVSRAYGVVVMAENFLSVATVQNCLII